MLLRVLVAILALISLATHSASQEDNTSTPLTFPARVIDTSEQVCPSDEVREMVHEIDQEIRNLTRNTILPTLCLWLGQTRASPVASCSALPAYCPSQYYWVRSSNGTAVQVYCDMNGVCACSRTGGWTRVARLNMSDPSQQCPREWNLQTHSSEPRRPCGRGNHLAGSCLSTIYNTYGISYNHVCGRVIGYVYHSADAFGQHAGPQTIEGPYMWMGCPSHMDLLEEDNTSGLSLLDF